ncbi:MAG: hypothetical protein EON86_04775 [Brevundimonas sp.]|nr:MAG: hypothetical protein EON86_04775 [Brevundimonas sp.]
MNILSPFKAADSAREQRASAAAEARLRDSKAAVETLKGRTSQASEERKAEARQKIEQLKARLQMLRSMASMDPEGTARLAAQLARELGAAVKAYAAAGGTGGGGGTTGVAVPAPTGVDAATTQTGDVAVATAESAPTDPTAGKAAGKSEDAGKSANPYQSVLDEQQAQAADMSRRSGEQRADREFMADVRKMAAELKALVRAATEKARAGDDDALSPQEAQDLDRSVADMDRQIGQATGDLGGGLVSLLV